MKHTIEYVLARCLAAFITLLGQRLGMSFARGLGWLIFKLDSRHRLVALENLETAFGDQLDVSEKNRIVCCAFQNLVLNAVELLLFYRLVRPDNIQRFIRFKDVHILEEALAEGRGVILVSAHLGNWELAGCAISMAIAPTYSIARVLKNEKIDRWVNQLRQKTGAEIIPKDGALRTMVQHLRDGKLLVFLLDQNAGSKGIPVDFFGKQAYTFDSVASLSKRFNVPVVFGHGRRVGDEFNHELRAVARIDPGDLSVEELTSRYTKLIEDTIREMPGQWLWMHRRWKEVIPPPHLEKLKKSAVVS